MNKNVKIALGIIASGTLVLAGQLLRSKKNRKKAFTAPDGNRYEENQMYRTAQGQIFKNGKQLHFETPELFAEANHFIDNYREKGYKNNRNVPKSVNYNQKGVRHH